ncbi:hypothetical protein NDU88_002486 [Pleurodeles waltl]|uniref:Uncharacterized protein n=1 Tax=Pleurodeles waltl TaxID=8319 RepID=A0AAV7VZH0_PLEWA|nr:hypothetical protein NDU88_002486 [Pleurodeles waltl]
MVFKWRYLTSYTSQKQEVAIEPVGDAVRLNLEGELLNEKVSSRTKNKTLLYEQMLCPLQWSASEERLTGGWEPQEKWPERSCSTARLVAVPQYRGIVML